MPRMMFSGPDVPVRRRTRRSFFRRQSAACDNGSFEMLTTDFGRRLVNGAGYRHRKPARQRLQEGAFLLMKVGLVAALSLALPAQAHGFGCW